jgi:hypothetical protein
MAQVVEHQYRKHKVMSSNPSIAPPPKRKEGKKNKKHRQET